jgi:cell division cycle protein 37
MILRLLEIIAKEARETAGSDEGELEKLLTERLEFHVNKLSDVTEERREEKDALLKERAKHITMDDLHDGFDSKVPYSYHPLLSRQRNSRSSPPPVHSCKARTSPSYRQRKGKRSLQDEPY